MALCNDFPDNKYHSVNSISGIGPALQKVLKFRAIRGKFEGIRQDRSFKVIFNEYFDNQLLCIISTDYGYSRILVTDEGFTFVQRPAAD